MYSSPTLRPSASTLASVSLWRCCTSGRILLAASRIIGPYRVIGVHPAHKAASLSMCVVRWLSPICRFNRRPLWREPNGKPPAVPADIAQSSRFQATSSTTRLPLIIFILEQAYLYERHADKTRCGACSLRLEHVCIF
jgi:hypothetical protein